MDEQMEKRVNELEARVRILEDYARKALRGNPSPRCDEMIRQYGEAVDKTLAAEILGVTRATVYSMLKDGRLDSAYEGKRVDVRSIARYMDMPGNPRPRGKAKETAS